MFKAFSSQIASTTTEENEIQATNKPRQQVATTQIIEDKGKNRQTERDRIHQQTH